MYEEKLQELQTEDEQSVVGQIYMDELLSEMRLR